MRRSKLFLTRTSWLLRGAVLGCVTFLAACGSSSSPLSAATTPLQIKSLSNRADLLSGGDALIEILLPANARAETLRVDVDGRDVSGAFALRPNGRVMGLLTELAEKTSTLTARAEGAGAATLALTNHPNGGPIFAGVQVQPWSCADGAIDVQCNRAVSYVLKYRSTVPGRGFMPYDPASPPADLANATTDQGQTVPYIIRIETGAQDRGLYQIAVLFDPTQGWEPWAPQSGWNGKTYITGGNGCGTTHGQRAGPSVEVAEALGRGFLVMTTSMANNTLNCNLVVQAEALMMLKERVIEAYGPIRYTIGSGCSGGSIYQQQVANAYPGIFDGILPGCSFPDTWSTMIEVADCRALVDYWADPSRWAPGLLWSEVQQANVAGHQSSSLCQSWVNVYSFDAVLSARADVRSAGARDAQSCAVPAGQTYEPDTNPNGTRCGLQDYMPSILGIRASDGFAQRPLDNIGIQYGLGALQAGQITPAQFLDLNAKVGGRNIDFDPIPARTEADESALFTAYRGGLVNEANELDRVPMIDLRGHSSAEIHHDYRSYTMRARLDKANGHHDNQVIWTGPITLIGDTQFEKQALTVMDDWLAAIEADSSELPLEQKVVLHKPASARDRCTDGNGGDVADQSTCAALNPYFASPRIVAGQPFTDDVMKCQLKPLDRRDYTGATPALSDAQFVQLAEIFPNGVCDFEVPGIGQQNTLSWLSYRSGAGDKAMMLGAAPRSEPLLADP